jgi:magnesium chelatase family protein
LCVSGQLQQSELDCGVFAGELALNGDLRPIKGAINITQMAKKFGFKKIFLPMQNIEQAGLIDGIEIYGVTSIKQLFLHLKNEVLIGPHLQPDQDILRDDIRLIPPLLDDVKGTNNSSCWSPQHSSVWNPRCGENHVSQSFIKSLARTLEKRANSGHEDP